jgi:hypothetical protein
MTGRIAVLPLDEAGLEALACFLAGPAVLGPGHHPAIVRVGGLLPGVVGRTLVATDEQGSVVGWLPLFEVTESLGLGLERREFLSGVQLPAGPCLAPGLPESSRRAVLTALLGAAESEARLRGADRLVIGLPGLSAGRPAMQAPLALPLSEHGFVDTVRPGLWLDLEKPPEELLQGVEGRCRTMIRRAERAGAVAAVITSRMEWQGTWALSQQYGPENRFSRAFLDALWDECVAAGVAVPVGVWTGSGLQSVVVAASWGEGAYYWLGFNRRPAATPGVNNLGLWQLLLECRQRGVRGFELGSLAYGSEKDASVSRFKRSFGGHPYFAQAGVKLLRPVRAAALDLAAAVVTTIRRSLPASPP